MLSHEENELLTRTGPRTAMGDVMRRYWIPAGWRAKCRAGWLAGARPPTGRRSRGVPRQRRPDRAPSTNIVHIGAQHCGSGATRGTGCVASITTGNSPSTALASIR